jgi:hypothetical protein
MFVGLANAYTDAINSGGVPTISFAWEGVTFQVLTCLALRLALCLALCFLAVCCLV